MGIWVVGTSNQIFVKKFLKILKKLLKIFKKNKVITGKTPSYAIGPFCTHHSICLDIEFLYKSFVLK